MSPEKRDAFIYHKDRSMRQPYLPRYTPAVDFPPPGSDVRGHGNKNLTVNGVSHQPREENGHEKVMSRSFSMPQKLNSHTAQTSKKSTNGPDFSIQGISTGEKRQSRFRTTFEGGTTSKSTYQDFGVLG